MARCEAEPVTDEVERERAVASMIMWLKDLSEHAGRNNQRLEAMRSRLLGQEVNAVPESNAKELIDSEIGEMRQLCREIANRLSDATDLINDLEGV